ncbi:MAG TPA: PIG-L family deacetylase [Chitinophagaceae bacterium]|nr:PIG-L family deacetylase [Chitinophagaceae bacterium]
MHIRILTFLLLTATTFITAKAQYVTPPSAAEIQQQLHKLNVLGSVLYIAAHPDDENTRLLAYLAKEKKYRTGYLSLTRGDGGQNLIGDEQGVELGLIRTQELLAARRIDGAEQFFTRAYDFGFSKSTKEALQKWNHDSVLADVVWVIRKFKPDVIITRFPSDSRAGHGHHSASSVLANEAFAAAADASKFPWQLSNGVTTWQAKRILWNTFNFGSGTNTTSEDQFKINVGVFNPVIGQGYGEIASESRSQHKSQGFGVPRQRGDSYEYFTTTGGTAPTNDLLDQVNTTWGRITNSKKIKQSIDNIIQQYNFNNPAASTKALAKLYQLLQQQPTNNASEYYWLQEKMKAVSNLIVHTAGLFAEATTTQAQVVQGDSLKLQLWVNVRSNTPVQWQQYTIKGAITQPLSFKGVSLTPNTNSIVTHTVQVQPNATTQPYWLMQSLQNDLFNVPLALIGKAENDAAIQIHLELNIEGAILDIPLAVKYKFTDPVKGEKHQPLTILPKQEMRYAQENYWSANGGAIPLVQFIKNNTQPNSTWRTDTILYQPTQLGMVSRNGNSNYSSYVRTIEYDHIPTITYQKAAVTHIINQPIKTAGKRVGYIAGAGDKTAEAIQLLGYEVVMLTQKDMLPDNLQKFDAIVTGVRAYNTEAWLSSAYDVLMQYVQQGGNLIVQYNTNNQIGPVRAKMSPYPFNISRVRVTEENASVTMLQPNHAIFNYPNRISNSDFDGWVQERSVYQAEQLDKAYIALLEMNDTGETPSKGSLIVAPYGKGNFVYTGLALFRQLPAGVPGAYKLLANLLSMGR